MTSSLQHNPALNHLEVLVGDWEMELSNASFLPDPSATVKGPVSFEWVQDGAFLMMRMGDQPPSPPLPSGSSAGMNRPQTTPCYTMMLEAFRESIR